MSGHQDCVKKKNKPKKTTTWFQCQIIASISQSIHAFSQQNNTFRIIKTVFIVLIFFVVHFLKDKVSEISVKALKCGIIKC